MYIFYIYICTSFSTEWYLFFSLFFFFSMVFPVVCCLEWTLEGVFYVKECLYDEIFLSQIYPSVFIDGPDRSVPH